ncbi:hypothetical protein [Haloferax larsenii]|uniref:Uncharacterized protein n=1 Tax=Haloferax larsenii TaxID=302484 RepID=A0A1H7N0X2_HALLR|nr:hypothetical protein [Haloferax larsenii]SEL17150.1 hypothetical protein SAMN04488691_103159 [Haloferax larsenii]
MTSVDKNGIRIPAQDLSALSPTANDHGRLYNHDGSNPITLHDGNTSTNPGIYLWDNDQSGWRGLKNNADTLDGQNASDFAVSGHDHDDRYYTETEADAQFMPKSGGTVDGPLDFSFEPNSIFAEFIENTTNHSLAVYVNNEGEFGFVPVDNTDTKNFASALWYDRINDNWEVGDDRVTLGSEVDAHTSDTSNPHNVTASQVGALENPISSALDMNGNYLDNRKGMFFGYGASHTGMDGGVHANIANSVVVSNGYTKNSSSSVQVNRSGHYKVNYSINFHQTGGNARAILAARVEVNGSAKGGQSESRCYIRNTADGDMNNVSAECVLNLNSGDDIQVYAWKHHGATGHDITHGRLSMEYLG